MEILSPGNIIRIVGTDVRILLGENKVKLTYVLDDAIMR